LALGLQCSECDCSDAALGFYVLAVVVDFFPADKQVDCKNFNGIIALRGIGVQVFLPKTTLHSGFSGFEAFSCLYPNLRVHSYI